MDRVITVKIDNANQQKDFLIAMNEINLINCSREKIYDWYREERERIRPTGWENNIVIHDDTKFERFQHVMKAFFKELTWVASDIPGDDEKEEIDIGTDIFGNRGFGHVAMVH